MGKHRWPISADTRSSTGPAFTAWPEGHDAGHDEGDDGGWSRGSLWDGAVTEDGDAAPSGDRSSSERLLALRRRSARVTLQTDARASSAPYTPSSDDAAVPGELDDPLSGHPDGEVHSGSAHGCAYDDGDIVDRDRRSGGRSGGDSGLIPDRRVRPAQAGIRWGIARSAALVFLGVALAVGAALFLVRSSEPSAAAVSVQLEADTDSTAASDESDSRVEEPAPDADADADADAAPSVGRAGGTAIPSDTGGDAGGDAGTGSGHAREGGAGSSGAGGGETGADGAGTIVVYVTGAVASPGVVRMPGGARLFEILERVGGPLPDADLEGINLAGVPADGEHLHVLAVGEPPRSTSDVPAQGSSTLPDTGAEENAPEGAAGTWTSGAVLDINTATLAEVESLPRVGPVLGQRIIEWRDTHGPFARSADIDAVPGIGPALLAGILPLITVR